MVPSVRLHGQHTKRAQVCKPSSRQHLIVVTDPGEIKKAPPTSDELRELERVRAFEAKLAAEAEAKALAEAPRDELGNLLPEIEYTKEGKVKWSGMEPLPKDWEMPKLATARFNGLVLRALQQQGRGEWQTLQVHVTPSAHREPL